ncbi:hypothetical protein [Pantoea trifolii]|uniref:Uncharacterized protein n=1 Tax=Pantoea trifolii TaxID=2968030 RepID=A0ABT1VG58_9GAMM|nr:MULTISPECIES: hypothetical protein [unclassified Pantoea]MCQ8226435.1 hypothetical protein [Pantoea sp. MMK2]MCQ8238355.1 hypothetical protein [Pantoea sp. MMK3]
MFQRNKKEEPESKLAFAWCIIAVLFVWYESTLPASQQLSIADIFKVLAAVFL